MNVYPIGLDLSLTCTGVATRDGTAALKGRGTGAERLSLLEAALRGVVDFALTGTPGSYSPAHRPVAVLEQPAFHRACSQTIALGEWRGVVLLTLYHARIPIVEISPGALKKFATGSGNAKKPEMAVAAFKRAGMEFRTDDECDAWWLMQAALTHYGDGGALDLPKVQREAIEKVAWPGLEAFDA